MAENNEADFYNGMFNLAGVMEGFYGYEPDSKDEVGNAIKNTFASNMIQSSLDQQMAMQMAQFQAGIGTQNMTTAANLELNNNSRLMTQDFEQGMQSMGAQFDYQNTFANSQFDRDIGMLGASGEQTRKTQDNESFNKRSEAIVAGEQQRQNTALQGGIDIDRSNIAADASKYGAQVTADANKYSSDAAVAAAGISADASRFGASESRNAAENVATTQAGAQVESAELSAEASKYGATQSRKGAENVATTQAGAQVESTALSADASKYGARQSRKGAENVATTQAGASMYGSDKSAEASMFGATQSRKGAENVATTQARAQVESTALSADASKYGARQSRRGAENVATTQAGASMYGAKQAAGASKYGADRSLEGVKDTNTTSTRNIRTTGDETRKNAAQANTFDVDRERRQQARSRAGARRY